MADEFPSLSGFFSFFSQKGLLRVKEIGKNKAFSSPLAEEMLKNVGWQSGETWCASLVKAVYLQCFPFDREWILQNLGKGAYVNFTTVDNLNNRGDKKYIVVKTSSPQVGDIAVWRKGSTVFGHTGIVTEVISAIKVKTVEGNTSEQNVRDGDGIYENTRNVAIGAKLGDVTFKGYIRRNFTQAEKDTLVWDEVNLCYYFKGKEKQASDFDSAGNIGTGLGDYFNH